MTFGANLYTQILHGRTRLKAFAASTCDGGIVILGMYILLQELVTSSLGLNGPRYYIIHTSVQQPIAI